MANFARRAYWTPGSLVTKGFGLAELVGGASGVLTGLGNNSHIVVGLGGGMIWL